MSDSPTERGAEGIWTRLRRRKVVQWGIAYAAGAWGLLQGLEYFIRTFGWPEQLQQFTTLALLIGLPILLVLAWYHGDRGERRVRRTELAIITLLFLSGGAVFWYYDRASETTTTSVSSPPTTVVTATDRSIAVLPFVNMSADKEQEYFADGISEELLNLLAQLPELRVIARTSSFSFKGQNVEIAEIARKLNVAHVLEGSVRRSGGTLRITAQLIRAADSSHVWSQTYDRQMTDVFKVQDEIAAAVVSELKVRLLGAAPNSTAADPRAYTLYLQARAVARQYSEPAMKEAIGLYQQAIALDADYPAAWVGLAYTYLDQLISGFRLPDDGIQMARDAIAKALVLDPGNAPAHACLGRFAIYFDSDLKAAAQHLERALTLEPANIDVIENASFLMRRLGRVDKAVAIAEYLLSRDPLSPDVHDELGFAYRYAGRLDEAIAAFRTETRLTPEGVNVHAVIGEVLLQKGDARAALAEIRMEPDEAYRLFGLSMAYHDLGQQSEADAALSELIKKYERTKAYYVACVLAYRGQADRAFEWLEKAAEYRDPTLGSTPVYPMLANLHSDPRWLPFLRKHGMAPEQLAAIKFDVKVPP